MYVNRGTLLLLNLLGRFQTSFFSKRCEYVMGEDGEYVMGLVGHNLFIIEFHNSATMVRVLEFGP